jgi:hypothetical protein
LSACFELQINKESAASAAAGNFQESSAIEFINEYFLFLDPSKVISVACQNRWEEWFVLTGLLLLLPDTSFCSIRVWMNIEDTKMSQKLHENLDAVEQLIQTKDEVGLSAILKNLSNPLSLMLRMLPNLFDNVPKFACQYPFSL